jgi:uncharacterized membrane protein
MIIHYLHGLVATLALLTGTCITLARKGTRFHKRIGYVYTISMLITIFSSFGIYDLFGGFGVYHVMSLVSLISILLGMYFPLFKRSNPYWVIHHYYWMVYSFIGLVMALGSHLMGHFPDTWGFWLRGFVAWGLPYIVGTIWVNYYKKAVQSAFVNV